MLVAAGNAGPLEQDFGADIVTAVARFGGEAAVWPLHHDHSHPITFGARFRHRGEILRGTCLSIADCQAAFSVGKRVGWVHNCELSGYSRTISGCDFPVVVRTMAAARMSVPPSQASGPSLSPSSSTPRKAP